MVYITNITLCIPDPKHISQHITLLGNCKKAFIYGNIFCHDAFTIDLICQASLDSVDQNKNQQQATACSSSSWWWILLLYGCYLASSWFDCSNNKLQKWYRCQPKKTIVLYINLDTNYIQYSYQYMNMMGYRFTWRAAAKEDMVSFASVYFSVLGGAYSSLGKYSTSYALKAENLAKRQIKMAKWLQDPVLECKCQLYYAEDLILQGKLKKSFRILNKQQDFATRTQNAILLTMCDSVLLKWKTASKYK
ncbi:unnamed protein product [Cunninghamella echinulata]